MQLHYYIDTTPKFCTTLTKPDNVNYVYTYLPIIVSVIVIILIITILLNASCLSIHCVRNTYIGIFYYYFIIVDHLLSALFHNSTYPFTITVFLSLRDAEILYQMFIITMILHNIYVTFMLSYHYNGGETQ